MDANGRLIAASDRGDLRGVEEALAGGADINAKGGYFLYITLKKLLLRSETLVLIIIFIKLKKNINKNSSYPSTSPQCLYRENYEAGP